MAKRKKVFVLIKGLGPGGAEKLLSLSLPHINRERFDYEYAYMLPWKDGLVPEFQQAEVPVHCLNYRQVYDLRVFPRLVRLLRERLSGPAEKCRVSVASNVGPVCCGISRAPGAFRLHWIVRLLYRNDRNRSAIHFTAPTGLKRRLFRSANPTTESASRIQRIKNLNRDTNYQAHDSSRGATPVRFTMPRRP